MILINTVDEKHFTLDGIKFAKIYQPLAQGSEAIGIYSIYDTKQRIQNSTKYTEFLIDGVGYGTQEATIAAILGVVWSSISDYDVEQLEGRVQNLEENQYSGVVVYETLASLPNPGTLLVSYKVSNDPTATNNGYYHWDGDNYVKDADLNQDVIDSIAETDLKTRFRLTTGISGYVKQEAGIVKFSYLYIIDSETGKRLFLTDGTHTYQEENTIALTIDNSIYFTRQSFENGAGNSSIQLYQKSWTTLASGEIAIAIYFSTTEKRVQYGQLFSIADKTAIYDSETEIEAIKEAITLESVVPEDSRLDENTEVTGDDSAGEWDIRYPSDVNNYVQKLTDEPEEYFKVSLDITGGSNAAFWMLNVIPTYLRDTISKMKVSIKGDVAGSVFLNTDSPGLPSYTIPITTDWVDVELDVIFQSQYGDMRFMFYTTSNVVFYIKNIELLPSAVAKNIDSLNDDVAALKNAAQPNILNTEKLPVVLSKFGDILFENSGVLNIGLFGDSWTHGVGSVSSGLISYAKYIARIMWDKYGYAGLGWFDFGLSNSTDMKCADDEAVSYTKGGTLTYIAKSASALGIPIAHTEMATSAYYNLAFDQGRAVDNAKIWFYNDAHFEYQVDGGAAVEVTADSVSGWQSVEINASISTLRITALSNDTIVFGVDLSFGDIGVKIHKIGCRGLTTSQSVAVNESNWKQGLQALNLDFFSTLLFTNDRTGSVNPSTVVSNTEELLKRVKEAYPNIIDAAVLCPSETPGGTGTYAVQEYVDALREYASLNNVPFASLVPIFGTPDQINALGTFYDYLHPSKKGDYMISEYLFKHFFEYHQY